MSGSPIVQNGKLVGAVPGRLKKQFDSLCSDFGMTASTAINVFARAVVRERKIPFEIVSPEPDITRERALAAFYTLREEAEKNALQGMTLDEINEKICLARESRG